jgi:pimeloyl-ACP methyl ester carboxylesterase
MADDLDGLLGALGIPQARIVGHSWGADIALHFALAYPQRVSDLVLIEAALLAPLADDYRSHDWEGWPYVHQTLEQLTGAPLPADKRHDLEYMVRLLMEIPVQYGPAQGRTRDEDVISRVLEVVMPMWNGSRAGSELTVESLGQVPHPALALYEANSVCLNALEELRERMPRLSPALLPGGKIRHFTGLEHPELILVHMKAFWDAGRTRPVLEGA